MLCFVAYIVYMFAYHLASLAFFRLLFFFRKKGVVKKIRVGSGARGPSSSDPGHSPVKTLKTSASKPCLSTNGTARPYLPHPLIPLTQSCLCFSCAVSVTLLFMTSIHSIFFLLPFIPFYFLGQFYLFAFCFTAVGTYVGTSLSTGFLRRLSLSLSPYLSVSIFPDPSLLFLNLDISSTTRPLFGTYFGASISRR